MSINMIPSTTVLPSGLGTPMSGHAFASCTTVSAYAAGVESMKAIVVRERADVWTNAEATGFRAWEPPRS
jgi:hypothetical protein